MSARAIATVYWGTRWEKHQYRNVDSSVFQCLAEPSTTETQRRRVQHDNRWKRPFDTSQGIPARTDFDDFVPLFLEIRGQMLCAGLPALNEQDCGGWCQLTGSLFLSPCDTALP